MSDPLRWLVWWLIASSAWIFLTAVVFTYWDARTHGEFKAWYDDAPFALCKLAIWVGWPILLLKGLLSKDTNVRS
jgi:hypothetical protein